MTQPCHYVSRMCAAPLARPSNWCSPTTMSLPRNEVRRLKQVIEPTGRSRSFPQEKKKKTKTLDLVPTFFQNIWQTAFWSLNEIVLPSVSTCASTICQTNAIFERNLNPHNLANNTVFGRHTLEHNVAPRRWTLSAQQTSEKKTKKRPTPSPLDMLPKQ